MSILESWYQREPKREISKDSPPKEGAALFLEVLRREFVALIKLNCAFMVFSLPLVTVPAALTALNKIMILMYRDQPVEVWEDFLAAFRAEWKRASLVGALYFPLLALSGLGLYVYSALVNNFVLYTVSMFVAALLVIAGFYLFAMLATLEMNLRGIFKNTVLLTFIRMPQNVATLLAIVLLTLLVVLFIPYSLIIVPLCYFSLVGALSSFCAYTALAKLVFTTDKNGTGGRFRCPTQN